MAETSRNKNIPKVNLFFFFQKSVNKKPCENLYMVVSMRSDTMTLALDPKKKQQQQQQQKKNTKSNSSVVDILISVRYGFSNKNKQKFFFMTTECGSKTKKNKTISSAVDILISSKYSL